MLSDGLEKSGDIAVQSGTFADIWQGFYGDVPVAIKSLRVYNSNDLQVVLKVSPLNHFVYTCLTWGRVLDIMQRGRCVETTRAPFPPAIFRRVDNIISTVCCAALDVCR